MGLTGDADPGEDGRDDDDEEYEEESELLLLPLDVQLELELRSRLRRHADCDPLSRKDQPLSFPSSFCGDFGELCFPSLVSATRTSYNQK